MICLLSLILPHQDTDTCFYKTWVKWNYLHYFPFFL